MNIGQDDLSLGFPGIDGLPFLNSTSPFDDWQHTQAQGVAPAGTIQVKFFALLVGLDGANTAYFDDLRASRIPEPGSLALLLAGLLALPLVRKRPA